MNAYSLLAVDKSYETTDGHITHALSGASFDAEEGAITCIIGPTGSGKSTALRLLAGLELADRGTVLINGGSAVKSIGAVGYLTQQHTLLPWLTVADNIALPLEAQGVKRNDRVCRAHEIADMLGLGDTARRYPHELSGGMRQRAAIGRLIASDARLWLLDEPFNNLDEQTQRHLQRLLLKLTQERRISVLMVTHLLDEAVYLSNRIIVLSAGPGHVVDVFDMMTMPHPRGRMSSEFGAAVERLRKSLESVISLRDTEI